MQSMYFSDKMLELAKHLSPFNKIEILEPGAREGRRFIKIDHVSMEATWSDGQIGSSQYYVAM